MFNRNPIFTWWIFHCHVSFRGSKLEYHDGFGIMNHTFSRILTKMWTFWLNSLFFPFLTLNCWWSFVACFCGKSRCCCPQIKSTTPKTRNSVELPRVVHRKCSEIQNFPEPHHAFYVREMSPKVLKKMMMWRRISDFLSGILPDKTFDILSDILFDINV